MIHRLFLILLFIFQPQHPEAKSPLMNNSRTTSRNGGRGLIDQNQQPPPLPTSNRPRGWDNGIGGYQTNTMLETRIVGGNAGPEGNFDEIIIKSGFFVCLYYFFACLPSIYHSRQAKTFWQLLK